jgi:hypothetical protein
MATAAQLRKLRKKYGLGEFKRRRRQSSLTDSEMARLYPKEYARFLRQEMPTVPPRRAPSRTRTRTRKRAPGRKPTRQQKTFGYSLLSSLLNRFATKKSALRYGVYPGAGGAQSTTTAGSTTG